MNENVEYIRMFALFPVALRRFLAHRLTGDEAKSIILERMAHREESFLRTAERSIYSNPRSPYLPLLRLAGCKLGDLQALVKQKGMEGTLRELRAAGVYVTFEEFKGRRPIERGGQTIPVSAADFDNPAARRDFAVTTSGSTGMATSVGQDLDYIAAGAAHQMVAFSAHGLLDTPSLHWMNMLPGNALRFILQRARYGQRVQCWYSPQGWFDSRYWLKYDAATLYMVVWMRALGADAPFPRVAKLDHAHVVARRVHELLEEHGHCLLYMSASRALRVCLAAEEAGWSLAGAAARVGGEPLTATKLAAMQRSGLQVLPSYGMNETGTIGFSCPHPAAPDDVHFLHDAFALFTHPYTVPGSATTVPAFNLTTLLDAAPKVMLNFQADDYGTISQRSCGCALEAIGFHTHLSDIRSYSKLVGEAVTLIGNEMMRILEDDLPRRFGGSPLDYQLMEQEDEAGFTRLFLIVSPRVAISDEQAVLQCVWRALADSSPAGDAARNVWQQAQTIQIKRQEPVATRSGKLLSLHIERTTTTPSDER